jgi:tetratricopeptide (TPR) repeat protein
MINQDSAVLSDGFGAINAPTGVGQSPTLITAAAAFKPHVDGYQVEDRLGEGGMGTVWRAVQSSTRRLVALKLLSRGAFSEQARLRFDREVELTARLEHPHIARVYDSGLRHGHFFYAMELIEGVPITQYCDQKQLGTRQRLDLFVQVCEAVEHAHQKGIIHRDLKPSNVLVAEQDGRSVAKVIDFGIAKATGGPVGNKALLTNLPHAIGTPMYMSPEQANISASTDVDTRSDVYSLGVVLYELLCGTTPFEKDRLEGASDDEVRRIIREEEPLRPSARSRQRNRALPAELDWIVMRAMEKDRTRRYQTIDGLALDMRRYMSGLPVEACPPSRAYRVRKFVRRNKGPVAASAAVLSALVVGLALATAFYIRAERQRQEAQTQATIAEAVSQFLSDMLGSADPRRSLGDKLTVLQATETAIKELDAGRLRDQPLVEAAVRATIGDSLISLGRFDVAEPNLRRSLELSRGAGNLRNRTCAASLQGLAYVLQARGQTPQAEQMAREALEIRRANLGPGHSQTTQSLILLAVVLQAQGKSAQAEPLLREALDYQRKALRPGHSDLTNTLSTLAGLLHVQGKLAEAEPLYREVVKVRRDTLPPSHPDLAQSLSNLAGLLLAQGRPTDAEPLLREALDIYRKALPASHPDIAQCARSLGVILRDQGKLSPAEPLLREALQIYRQTLPAEHPEIATSLSTLASVLQWQGKLDEAELLAREAVAINRNSLPTGHWATAQSLNYLATLLLAQHKPAEAEALAREALEIYRHTLPDDDLNDAWSLNNLAEALKAQRKLDEAELLHREALDIHRRVLSKGHPKLVDSLIYLANTLSEQGKLAECERLLREALEIETKTHGVTGARASWVASLLATVLDKLDRRDDADAIRRQHGLDHPASRATSSPASPRRPLS